MVIAQRQIWWADLPVPTGSGPGYFRPAIVIQGDSFNHSPIGTVVCITLTTNLRLADAPGNVVLLANETGLPADSVVNVSQIVTIDRGLLIEFVGTISKPQLELILKGIDLVLGR